MIPLEHRIMKVLLGLGNSPPETRLSEAISLLQEAQRAMREKDFTIQSLEQKISDARTILNNLSKVTEQR